MELVVLADTHLRDGIGALPAPLLDALARSDAIVHAGDIVSARALAEARRLGPLHAVLGNNDHELTGVLPEQLELLFAGVRLAVVHDSGPARGRPARLARRYPDADVVVFGHSHVPVDEPGPRGQLLFNPGSPTQRRSQPFPTFGRLHLDGGRVVGRVVQRLDRPRR